VNTPQSSSIVPPAAAGGAFSQPAPIVQFSNANHHQNRPNEVKATMPKVLPTLNSSTPAISCAMPP
jgi:hypothetical protein